MITRCTLCRICLNAIEDPSTDNIRAAAIAFTDSDWYPDILCSTFNWNRSKDFTKSYFRHNIDSLNLTQIKHFAACLLFEKMPTKWEMPTRLPKIGVNATHATNNEWGYIPGIIGRIRYT